MSSKVEIEVSKNKDQILGSTKTALYFPSDLKNAPYYMVFTPIKYSRVSALSPEQLKEIKTEVSREQGNTSGQAFSLSKELNDFGTTLRGVNRGATPKAPTFEVNFESGQLIALPLPTSLSDSLSLSYNATDMGVTAAGFQAGQAIGKLGFGVDEAVGAGAYAIRSLSNFSDQIGGLLNLMAGNVPNPYSILTFKNVEQRTFSFDWVFAPNSEVESRSIREIINTIRYLALPEQNGLFLEFPHEWEVQFVGTKFLYALSRGYITDIKIEYGTGGGNAFFPIQDFEGQDAAPTQIKFSFTFKEIYPLNKTLALEAGDVMAPNSTYKEKKEETVQSVRLTEEQISSINEGAKKANAAVGYVPRPGVL